MKGMLPEEMVAAVLVEYIAVRSSDGEYLGCKEACRPVDGE